jgi:hypothetical protein
MIRGFALSKVKVIRRSITLREQGLKDRMERVSIDLILMNKLENWYGTAWS